jgi:hypothetical protein
MIAERKGNKMKMDELRFVFEHTESGWKEVFEGKSFTHACLNARLLHEKTGGNYCVNAK